MRLAANNGTTPMLPAVTVTVTEPPGMSGWALWFRIADPRL
ncbi:hypothetical protein ACN27F_05440 [Solwaraspora sp. WMMB335]